jgi:hypothetical protein
MRLGRAADALAGSGAGLYALLCALAAVAGFIVGWTKVGQAVVVSGAHMVDGVGAGEPAQVTDVAVGGEDQRPDLGVPAGGQQVDAPAAARPSGGHRTSRS